MLLELRPRFVDVGAFIAEVDAEKMASAAADALRRGLGTLEPSPGREAKTLPALEVQVVLAFVLALFAEGAPIPEAPFIRSFFGAASPALGPQRS